ARCGMHFLKKPATTMASYAGRVARKRSSAVGSNSAALAPASTSVANRRDSSWSSRCCGVSVKSMAMETFPNLIDPVYSINRYRIGAGKSRMLAPDFLAYGALGRDSRGSSGACGHGMTKLAGACAIAALEQPVEMRNIPKARSECDFGDRPVSRIAEQIAGADENPLVV